MALPAGLKAAIPKPTNTINEATATTFFFDIYLSLYRTRETSVTIHFVVELPKIELIQSPTPLHRLNSLSDELGIDLWIKRDDLTGFAFGGNKGRKLEYLMPRARGMNAEVVVTCGGAQSNFIRQLAAACSCQGMRLVAVVMQLPYEDEPAEEVLLPSGGNLLLDELLGAEIHVLPNGTWDELYEATAQQAARLRAEGLTVYEIPIGGSSPEGAYAFYRAGQELMAQSERPFDMILTASSSGSTQTGLTYAFHGSPTVVQGIACDPEPDMPDEFVALAAKLDALTLLDKGLVRDDFRFNLDYVGPGYGVPSEDGLAAIRRLARTEGIFLDPIYSGKAFAGLLDLAERGKLPPRVCFWHTGGTPTLFALPQ